MESIRLCIALILFVNAALQNAIAQNVTYDVPLEPSLVGESLVSTGCSPGGAQLSSLLRIESWGILFSPTFGRPYEGGPLCRTNIVSMFRRRDKPALILYRPSVNASFFASAAPQVFKTLQKDVYSPMLCDLVPTQEIEAWGPTRNTFIKLIHDSVSGIQFIRDFDCNDERGVPFEFRFNEPETTLKRHLVANAALTYLRGVAYDNFFRI